MIKFIAPLLTVATLVAVPLGVSADDFTFTDDRCRPEIASAICVANATAVPVSELIGNTVDYNAFVALNQNVLPADVNENTILPARTFYVVSIKS